MKTSKVLFLDFDDVLNTSDNLARGELFDSGRVDVFNTIADRVDFDIVVTSTWRLGATSEELEELLVDAGLHASGRVVGTTPALEGETRGAEIMAWMQQEPEKIFDFVILDDRSDMGSCMSHLVRTDPQYGLVQEQVGKVVAMLTTA